MTAILTNPIWVVKVRTFTAPPNSPAAHRGLWSAFTVTFSSVSFLLTSVGSVGGFRAIVRDEGWGGLYRGTSLALFGVSNGALQFVGYEKMKSWAFERRRRRVAKLGRAWTTDDDKLVRLFSRRRRRHTNLTRPRIIKSPIPHIRSCPARRRSARYA